MTLSDAPDYTTIAPEYAEPDIVDILTPEEYEYHCYDYMELNGFR